MTAQALPNLRPLNLGELLDQAIRLYRRNFFKFIGIIAMMQIPVSLITLAVNLLTFEDFYQVATDPSSANDPSAVFTPGYFIGLGSTFFVGFLSFLLIQGVATAALTRQVADTYLGEAGGMLDAYRRVGNRWLPLVGTLVLYFVLAVVLFIWLIIPCIGWFTGPGMFGVLAGMVLPLVSPVVVLEASSGLGAMRRAWELVRRRFWWVLGFMLVLFLFALVVVSGPAALISAAFQFLLPNALPGLGSDGVLMVQTILQSVTSLFFSLLYLPLQLACITLLYFDLRVRQEGLDLMLLAEGERAQMNLSDLVARTPPAPGGSVLTWNEVGYMVLLSIGGVAIYVVIIVIFAGMIGLAGGF